MNKHYIHTKLIIALLAIVSITGCQSINKKNTESQDLWSVKMANSVMQRYDSLGYYNNRTRLGWSYDIAMLGLAIDKLGSIDPKYSAYMQDYIDAMVEEDGTVPRYSMTYFNLDLINPGKNLLTLYQRTKNEKYKKALPQLVKQMEEQPTTPSGGFWHKKAYPNQMWLDGIYMSSPFLAEYAKDFNAPEWFDVVTIQITLIYEKTLDPNTGLLYHAWDESKEQKWSNPETGQSPHFWARSMGWYVMAIVDVLDYLPEDHPQREELISILNDVCAALVKVQDAESGVWRQLPAEGNKEGNYLEASGSAMYVYAFAKGAKKGYLPQKYLTIANEGFDAIVKNFVQVKEDGLIDLVNICGSCGLGGNPYRDGSYEYYVTEKIVTNDSKGVAPFIMAAVELNK